MENLNSFVIGKGEIGCELLKYFSLICILTITDRSWLYRKILLNMQFLFRERDINENISKGEYAFNSIRNINNKINWY